MEGWKKKLESIAIVAEVFASVIVIARVEFCHYALQENTVKQCGTVKRYARMHATSNRHFKLKNSIFSGFSSIVRRMSTIKS
jgi:hypothetical protein